MRGGVLFTLLACISHPAWEGLGAEHVVAGFSPRSNLFEVERGLKPATMCPSDGYLPHLKSR